MGEVGEVSQTQSIIVYRNPLEQQAWESGILPVIFGAGVLFIILTVFFMKMAELIAGRRWYVDTNPWVSWVSMGMAALFTGIVAYALSI